MDGHHYILFKHEPSTDDRAMKSKEANDIKDLLALYRSTACQILLVDANTDDDDADHLEFLHQVRGTPLLVQKLCYILSDPADYHQVDTTLTWEPSCPPWFMELWQPQKENIPFDRFSVCLQLNKSADRICPGSIFSYITATVRCRNNPPEKLMITIAFLKCFFIVNSRHLSVVLKSFH